MRTLLLAFAFLSLLAISAPSRADEYDREGPTISGGGGNSRDSRDLDEDRCLLLDEGTANEKSEAGSRLLGPGTSAKCLRQEQQL